MIPVIIKSLKYFYKTKSVWWYTSSAKTRARYIKTALGSLWLGISNIIFISVLGVVYGIAFQAENFKDYFIYLGLGYSVWFAIGGALNAAPEIFSSNDRNLLNTNINPLFYVFEEWSFQVQTFFQSQAMVLVFLSIFDPLIIIKLLYTPLHLINIILFIFWAPLTFCLTAARYTDFYQLIPNLTQLIFLMSPILYAEKNLGQFGLIAELNPIYKILALFRDSIIDGKFYLKESIFLLIINLTMCSIVLFVFDKYKKKLVFYFS